MRRYLSLSQKLALIVGSSGIFAIGLIVFGLFFGFVGADDIDWQATIHLGNNSKIGSGEVLDIFETNTTINDEIVIGYEYVFHSPIGDLYWTSYDRGSYVDVGETVDVEYDPDRPYVHRIREMKNSTSGVMSLIFMIPFFIGVIWMIINTIKGLRRIDIISHGVFTGGKFLSKETSGVEINDRTQYKYSYAYTTKEGEKHETYHKSTDNIGRNNCTVMYHSLKRDQAVILEFLPWSMGKTLKAWRPSEQ